MSGVTLSDLSKYHQGAMKWFKDGLVSEQNRLFAQTGEAGAVSFWPLGGTPLEGKVKFSFKETPPASGDKGPDNPSVIAGVSTVNITRCGRNLCPNEFAQSTMQSRGVVVSRTTDGIGWHFSGTAASSATPYLYFFTTGGLGQWPDVLERGKTYLFSVESNDANVSLQVYDSNSISSWGSPQEGKYVVHTTRSNGKSFIFRVQVTRGATVDTDAYVHVEEIDRLVSFEPYEGINNVISLGDTYYGGEIDLATGLMTVTHFGTTISGMNAADAYNGSGLLFARYWPTNTNAEYINAHGLPRPKKSSGMACNRFPTTGSVTDDRFVIGNYNSGNKTEYLALYLNPETVGITETSLTGTEVRSRVNAYLANHPLTFVYELYTPFTVQLTPLQLTALTQKDKYTPRMNTVYTDADSIQISYRKSLIHDEDEKVQAIVALGGNV